MHLGKDARGDISWGVIWIILMGLGAAALGAYTVYKYRIRVCLLEHTCSIFGYIHNKLILIVVIFFSELIMCCRHTWTQR